MTKREENQNRKKRKLVYWFLFGFLFVSIVSGGLYAYWAGNISNPAELTKDPNVITIGQANNVETTLTVSDPATDTKKLVPAGKTKFSVGGSADNVETITKTMTVAWQDNSNTVTSADNVTGTLSVTATPEIEGAQESNNSLINVTVTPESTPIQLNGTSQVEVSVTVTMTEPASKAVYDDIINKPILLHLAFNVTQAG
ncbi:hypothetical protein SAG0136_10460 [Streptococcus agalactiae LMG 14747]|uniref:Uncharacterized protein n=1 Tax=Streptococcus agalactiae LMG 14747 TaxID=1154860 RepID=V6Z7J3_STRAG|nr:hypothetical protein SAG0136_10460 [Streptococcus agalactiae LMG 14747]